MEGIDCVKRVRGCLSGYYLLDTIICCSGENIRNTHGGPNLPASRNQSVVVPETVDKIGGNIFFTKIIHFNS